MKNNLKLNFALLCDYAFFDSTGKVNIIGIFQTISTNTLPYIHPQMFLVLNFTSQVTGTYKVHIQVLDMAKQSLLKNPIELNMNSSQSNKDMGIVARLDQLTFKADGKYLVEVRIDGESYAELPIIVNKVAS